MKDFRPSKNSGLRQYYLDAEIEKEYITTSNVWALNMAADFFDNAVCIYWITTHNRAR